MEKKIEDLGITELKALVYDEIAKKEQAERNIKALNSLIGEKLNTPVDPKTISATPEVDLNTNKDGTSND